MFMIPEKYEQSIRYRLKDVEDTKIEEKYYYKTSKGDMMRVYPSTMYGPLFRKLREDYPHNEEIIMEFDNKNHHFMIKGEVLDRV